MGFLLFVDQGLLKAQKLNMSRLQLEGDSVPVADGILAVSASMNGTLAYRATSSAPTQLTWFDRSGRRLETAGRSGNYIAPALSPDEARVAVGREGNIWVLDFARGTETRITSDPVSSDWPVWSPDGRQILYQRGGNLFRKASSGAGAEEALLEGQNNVTPTEWSADGRFVSYFASGASTLGDLYLLPMSGDRKPLLFLQTRFQEAGNRLSPDGKWMAYGSNESGNTEVYVQTVPPSDKKLQISTAGGAGPMWRSDQRELFYMEPNGRLMALDIKTTPTFEPGIPRPLFQTNSRRGPFRNSYAPTRDGLRFLVNSFVEGAPSTIVVLLHWPALMPN